MLRFCVAGLAMAAASPVPEPLVFEESALSHHDTIARMLHASELIDGNLDAVQMEAHEVAAMGAVELGNKLNKAEAKFSPAAAAAGGFEITVDGTGYKQEEIKGMFQGDMESVNNNHTAHLTGEKLDEQYAYYSNLYATTKYASGKLWPDNTMNYCYESTIAAEAKNAIEASFAQFKKIVPDLKFVNVGWKEDGTSGWTQRCQKSPAVFFSSSSSGCFAVVGASTAKSQSLNLQSPGCTSLGIAMHEILHALGQGHEQSRPDRDEYVTIDTTNIKDGKAHNFGENKRGDTERKYDILSLMHYGDRGFAIDRSKPNIIAKPAAYHLYTEDRAEFYKYKMGNRMGLTQTDADQLADMYGIKANKLSGSTCTDKKQGKWKTSDGNWNYNCDEWVGFCKSRFTCVKDTMTGDECPACPNYYGISQICCKLGGGARLQKWVPKTASPEPAPSPASPAPASPTSPAPSSPAPAPPKAPVGPPATDKWSRCATTYKKYCKSAWFSKYKCKYCGASCGCPPPAPEPPKDKWSRCATTYKKYCNSAWFSKYKCKYCAVTCGCASNTSPASLTESESDEDEVQMSQMMESEEFMADPRSLQPASL